MDRIIILDENTSNKIAAGEVIERPSSVIKELVENSIDAGASIISVEINKGGISFMRVTDNGKGIPAEDVPMAFERHATSKIRSADDLVAIRSMGFRGEALASIAAVSLVQMSTRAKNTVQGTRIEVKGGVVTNMSPAGCPEGTSITVKELFYNTPARYKFLKKDATEAGSVAEIMGRIALGHPDISFKLVSNGSVILGTPGNGDLKSAIFSIYGGETAKQLLEVNYEYEGAGIFGFVGKAQLARSNRNCQSFYINKRSIKNKIITAALDSAYSTYIMKNRYAVAVLNIELNPALADVNVHPSKMEVKFSGETDIYRAVHSAVSNALLSGSTIMTVTAHKGYGAATPKKGITDQESPAYKQQLFHEIEEKAAEVYESDAGSDDLGLYSAGSDSEHSPFLPELTANLKIIGQIFSTYILLEHGNDLLLVDQHAAHERIRYEEIKEAFDKNQPVSQLLLLPIHIELTAPEYRFALDETSLFSRFGFEYEEFGVNSILLRSVPLVAEPGEGKEMFSQALSFLMEHGGSRKNALEDEVLFRLACRSSIMANKKLAEKEISALWDRLISAKNPYTCPHGRPVVLLLTKYELEKLFKRIV